jgi:arylsulfatase A-like enzyme
MKTIFILFDSLAKKYLSSYGNEWIKAPNFQRLAERSVTFDKCYVGSMPSLKKIILTKMSQILLQLALF